MSSNSKEMAVHQTKEGSAIKNMDLIIRIVFAIITINNRNQ